ATGDAQGFADRQSAASLFCLNGDGSFTLRSGQAVSERDSVAILFDRAGSNAFSASAGPAQGIDRGLAIFLHDRGEDRFPQPAGTGTNIGNGDSLGICVDLAAAPGRSSARVREGMGLAIGPLSAFDALSSPPPTLVPQVA